MSTQMNNENAVRADAVGGLVNSFDVREWASSKIYRRGLDYFRNDCVISFELADDNSIDAEVEGSEIYSVKIEWDDDGTPLVNCSCPYDWEPMCKHAVAALMYWQERGVDGAEEDDEDDEQSSGEFYFDREGHIAELAELEAKKRRSRKSLESIRILKSPKQSLCGNYVVTSSAVKASYTVTVRDTGCLDLTTCNCPDYLINELGTCKHIELVKARVGKKTKGSSGKRSSKIWISIKPRNTYGQNIPHYEEIHIHCGNERVNQRLFGEKSVARGHWTEEGYLRASTNGATAKQTFNKAIRNIEKCLGNGSAPKIVIDPQVTALIERLDVDRTWKARLDGIIRSPKTSQEWTALKRSLPIKLYDYQEEGILFAARNRRSFIGDDMGLGKTVQAIVVALFIDKLKPMGKVLVFCPASLKFQWKREIEKFSKEKAQIVHGNIMTRRKVYKESQAKFLIVNYELIFRDEEFLHRLGPDMIILDEAQRIKNWETKTAKGIKRLRSEFALILTGTPFENRLLELHSLCEFLHPRALGPMWRLMPTYGNLDEHDKLMGFSNLSHLRQSIAPFFIRREKEDVLGQLPDRVVNEYTVEISSAQKTYHDDYEAAMAQILSRAKRRPLTPKEMRQVFMCLSCMRIISNALAQHEWKKFRPIVDEPEALSITQIRGFHSPKLMEFRSVMEDLLDKKDTKFVIFSQWERMLLLAEASIRDLLMERGMESVIFSGSLPTPKRGKVIDRFINDPKLRIFFSTDAGGLGLNLQESANYVINLEMPWNPAVLEQRIGRIHRIGQKKTVNVINLISTNCIEERVYSAVQNKRLLFDGVFDGKTDEVTFEKGSAFIDRLKEVMGDGFEEDATKDVKPEVLEELKSEVSPSPLPLSRPATKVTADKQGRGSKETPLQAAGDHQVDLTGLVNAIGSWMGNEELANSEPGSFRIGIEQQADEFKVTVKKPPKELLSGMKKMFSSLAEMIDVE